MKRLTIIALAVLIALSFVSCSKDKTEEVIKNYEDYKASRSVSYINTHLISNYSDFTEKKPGKVEKNIDDEDFKSKLTGGLNTIMLNNIGKIWNKYGLSSDVNKVKVLSVTPVSGNLKGTYTDEQNYEYSLSNVVINFTYDTCDKDGTKLNDEPIEGVLSASIGFEKTYDYSLGVTTLNYSSITLNGTQYRDLYIKTDPSSAVRYTDVRIGGESVDLRLVNEPQKNL